MSKFKIGDLVTTDDLTPNIGKISYSKGRGHLITWYSNGCTISVRSFDREVKSASKINITIKGLRKINKVETVLFSKNPKESIE